MTATRRAILMTAALVLTLAARATADEPKAPPAPERMMMWVERWVNQDCALKTQVTLNGKNLGTFDSNTQRDITGQIKVGTNTISFATTPDEPASHDNHLTFEIGAVTTNPKTKRTIMNPLLMRYDNSEDWKRHDDTGKYTHPFGPNPKTPDRKTVTHTYTFEYVGASADLAEPKEGAYVLQVESWMPRNASVTTTLTVNGKSLGSFMAGKRSLDVTRLLKAGENEIRLTTDAVANQLHDIDNSFEVLGPLSYDVAKERFVGKRVIQFKAMEGWVRDKKTAQLHVKGSPGKISHERMIRFTLEEAPK